MKKVQVEDVPAGEVFLYQEHSEQPLRAWIRLAEQPDGTIWCESYFCYKGLTNPGKYLYLSKRTWVLV